VTIQAPLYHIGDVQLTDCRSASQLARGEHPAPSPASKTFGFGYVAAGGGGGGDGQRGDGGLGVARALVQEVLGGVCVVGIRFPVRPTAMVPTGSLGFGAALWTVIQGDQEAGLGMGFGAGFSEAIVGVESLVVTYPMGDGAQGLPHLAVGCGARQLSFVVQSTAIQL